MKALLLDAASRFVGMLCDVHGVSATAVLTLKDGTSVCATKLANDGDAVEWYAHTANVFYAGTGLLPGVPVKEGLGCHPGAVDSGSTPGG